MIDPAAGIASSKTFSLHPIQDEDKSYPAELEGGLFTICEMRNARAGL